MAGDGFWTAEVAWQTETVNADFSVSLEDARSEGSRLKPFVTYLLVSSLCPEGVRRRYSDFEWLRELLKFRFHGIAVPVLPEKKVIGNTGPEFIDERRRGLTSFMRNVCINPYLRNDTTLKLFLTVHDTGAGEWEQTKKAASAGEGAHPSANLGLNRWFGVLRHLSLPADADAAASSLNLHLIDLDKALKALQDAVVVYTGLTAKLAEVLGEVKRMTSAVQVTAAGGVATLSAALPEPSEHADSFSAIFTKFDTAVTNLTEAVAAPDHIKLFLDDPIIKEITRISALRELLSIRDGACREYNTAWQRQEKLEFEQKQFELKGRHDKASLMEPQVAQAGQYVKQCRERLDDISKGLLHVEARKFGTVRNEKFTHIFGQYGALGVQAASRVNDVWVTFLGAMGLSEHDMVPAAQQTLSASSSDDATLVRYVIQPTAGMMADPAAEPVTPARPLFAPPTAPSYATPTYGSPAYAPAPSASSTFGSPSYSSGPTAAAGGAPLDLKAQADVLDL